MILAAMIAYEVFAVGLVLLVGWLGYRHNVAVLTACAMTPRPSCGRRQ